MSKKTSAMLDIKKGRNLERSLPAFADELSAVYGKAAILNLSMNYANYFVNTKEKETDRSFDGAKKKINALKRDMKYQTADEQERTTGKIQDIEAEIINLGKDKENYESEKQEYIERIKAQKKLLKSLREN